MAWTYLFLAALCEIAMGISLKLNEGWTRPLPSLAAVASGLLSIYLLALSLRTLPLGMAYAVWTGMGTLGLIAASVVFFQDTPGVARSVFIAISLVGIVGLRLTE